MATQISTIELLARQRLVEETPRFWSSEELTDIIIAGIKDLWRDIVDLKQEHFLTINNDDVTFEADATSLTGVPTDVHKIYLLEPVDTTIGSSNQGLVFAPMDYNSDVFASARSKAAIDPTYDTIYYSITSAGGPVNSPTIYCAPKVTSAISVSFCYVPTLAALTSQSDVPIPGEVDNALVAWTVAFARGKEKEDRMPDAGWLATYATDKAHLLESLGVRQYQEPTIVPAMFASYW